jgi:hypothetical protein
MLKSNRRLGWMAVCVLVIGSLASYWFAGPSSDALELTDAERSKLATLIESDYSEWLTQFADTLNVDTTAKQVLLLQGVPNEPPLVIAAPQDTDGDEEPTHWRAPWPALAEGFRSGRIEQPLQLRSRYQGFDYIHHLIPFESTHTRCVLINQIAPAPNWLGFRFLAIFLATLGFVALLIAD